MGKGRDFPDEWGNDPTVQTMRRMFSRLEKAQSQLLDSLSIAPLHPRLRKVRTEARDLFEMLWPLALQRGIVSGEEQTVLLYLSCLKHSLKREGFAVPDHGDAKEEEMRKFLKEALR
ncbi:MAG: hypothetical protein N3G78_12545 [Desulfobacterota bacterium]|nr:hypothetical protein [Thermodesulfobacteriota bacterium]